MPIAKADPRTSPGAQMERESMRRYLRREIARVNGAEAPEREGVLLETLRWLLTRSRRYSRRQPGLGR